MEKTRSSGVTLIGRAEIIIGFLGTVVFAMCLFSLFSGAAGIGAIVIIPMLFFTIISPLFLFAGIGILKLEPWGVKINLIGIPIIIFLLGAFIQIGRRMTGNPTIAPITEFAGMGLLTYPMIYFILPIFWCYFNRPSVEKQFRHEDYPERASWNTIILLAWLLIAYAAGKIITYAADKIIPTMLFDRDIGAWIAVFLLIGSTGLLKLKNWGRRLTILAMLIGTLVEAFAPLYILTYASRISKVGLIMLGLPMLGTIVIRLLVIIFLTRPKVKEQFK